MLRFPPVNRILLVSIREHFNGVSANETSTPIPEISDADMAFQAETTHANSAVKPFRKQYRLFHATFAQFCYTGSQVAIAGYFINYVTETRPNTSSTTASRFLAGAQVSVFPPFHIIKADTSVRDRSRPDGLLAPQS